MAYDEQLAERVRAVIAGEPDLTETRMFGGLAFLLGGHMTVAVSGQGGLMVRVDPADTDTLVESEGITPMEMRGRAMKGWLQVMPEAVATDDALAPWVARGVAFVRTLPPKGS